MSQRSDDLITDAAWAEYQRLKESVVRAAKAWRYAEGKRLAHDALNDTVFALISFEERHRERLNAKAEHNSTEQG